MMSSSRISSNSVGHYDWGRGATTALIQIYKGYPCMYSLKSFDYNNRNKRMRALQEITIQFNKRLHTNVAVEVIKKKLHCIRTQYFAEVNKCVKSGGYKPKWWCYELLQFMQREYAPLPKASKLQTPAENIELEEVNIKNEDESELRFDELHLDVLSPTSATLLDSTSVHCSPAPSTLSEEPAKRKGDEALFGQWIVEEMAKIDDDDILDKLKERIIDNVFTAKRKCRRKNE